MSEHRLDPRVPAQPHAEPQAADVARLTPAQSRTLLSIAGAVAAFGLVGSAAAACTDPKRFAYAWLTGFAWLTTIGLGGLLLTIIQHLTRSSWSVVARRHLEWISGVLPICALLFVPVALTAPTTYHEWMGEGAHADALIAGKAVFLNPTFFFIRAGIYFAIWSGISWFFRSNSLAQDASGEPGLTFRMQKWSAPAVLLTGLTLTLAGFDWLMSLEARWYSTIWGVYVFAGAAVSSLSVLALVTLGFQDTGLLRRASNVEHRLIVGMLLFAFVVFYAYIAFCQYFLIWYANMPEETIFYKHRWEGSWQTLSIVYVLGHFVVPFCLLLSRTAKKSTPGLGLAAALLLGMHYLDMYWVVMPNLDAGAVHVSWVDGACLTAFAGILATWLAWRAGHDNIYPVRDPRLAETLTTDTP